MLKIFCPETPLEHAVRAGDHAQTLSLLRAMPVEERVCHRASVRRMKKLLDDARWSSKDDNHAGWGTPPLDEQVRALFAMLVVCGTAQDVASSYGNKGELLALCSEFRPDSLQGLAEAMLANNARTIETVQELIVAGLVPRPDNEDYVVGLISLPYTRRFDQIWAADPGLRDVLLRVMDVEGSSEFNLAAVDKYTGGTVSWSCTLRRLCDEGVYTRGQLLDRTLAALERDWPQFRAGWFSRFHGELAPDLPLLSAQAQRYLGLCHSRIPPTVTLALNVIKRLEPTRRIDDHDLLDALRPVMHASAKGQVLVALRLLDARIKLNPALASIAAERIVVALAHESADVQGQVLQRLARWGCDEGLRAQLPLYANGIAAVHGAALRALIGGESMAPSLPPALCASAPVRRGEGPMSPLDDRRQLLLPGDMDALVACIAQVFENDTGADAFEMAAAALVQATPFDALQRERLGPVIKRAAKVRTPVAQELARLLLALSGGSPRSMQPVQDFHGNANEAQHCLASRTDAWIHLALLGQGLPPLSTPTHREGFIAPGALVERTAHYVRAGVDAGMDEQVRALLRLDGRAGTDAMAAARELPDSPFARALRYALGDDLPPEAAHGALFAAAARIRFPGRDDPALIELLGDIGPDGAHAARYAWRVHSWSSEAYGKVYHHHALVLDSVPAPRETGRELLAVHRHQAPRNQGQGYGLHYHAGFGGSDDGLLRLSATLLPSCLEAYFADGVRAIGNNLDWWQAQWPDKIYLERLLDPAVAMGSMATLLLALGLAAKEPGQQALAVDALVASWNEGRLEVDALAGELRALSATPLVKASRYGRSFKAVLRLEPMAHALAFQLLCEMVVARPMAPQRDIAVLFEILQELMLAHGHSLAGSTRDALQTMHLKGRPARLLNALLAT